MAEEQEQKLPAGRRRRFVTEEADLTIVRADEPFKNEWADDPIEDDEDLVEDDDDEV